MLNLPGFSDPLVQNSRYKDGTTKTCSIALSVVPYRALQCDRCLVITTRSNRSAPFHGVNTGSNPVGDANTFQQQLASSSIFPRYGDQPPKARLVRESRAVTTYEDAEFKG